MNSPAIPVQVVALALVVVCAQAAGAQSLTAAATPGPPVPLAQPGSELFVVYNDGRDTAGDRFAALQNRAIVFKINRLFRY